MAENAENKNEAPKGLIRPLHLDATEKVVKEESKADDVDESFVDFALGDEKPKPDPKETPAQKLAREAADKGPTARNYDRFKAYADKDITNDDELEEVVKSYKTKAEKLEVLVKGDTELQGDEDYKFYRKLLNASPEEKVTAKLVATFMQGGLSQEDAQKEAAEEIKANEANPRWLKLEAVKVFTELSNLISGKEKEAVNKITNAKKDLTFAEPSADFEKSVKESQTNIKDFLGMKLSKDDKQREKLVSEAYIEPTKLSEMLKDPVFYNKVCLLKKYEKQWTANIENRTNGKSKLAESLRKTPSIGSGLGKGNTGNSSKTSGFQVSGRLARKTS